MGNISGGLSHLDVAAAGRVTAMTVAAAGGSLLVWQLRRRQRRPLREDPAGESADNPPYPADPWWSWTMTRRIIMPHGHAAYCLRSREQADFWHPGQAKG